MAGVVSSRCDVPTIPLRQGEAGCLSRPEHGTQFREQGEVLKSRERADRYRPRCQGLSQAGRLVHLGDLGDDIVRNDKPKATQLPQ